ncbi:hypothetical protein J9317_12300 [Metabacillus sp. KIGAM252]|uniref:Uncharacterized protein n=1 Tax=Metabacillus flavus TaxID=2823519 RepID=A0ABS5LG15_9BACI|nr:hypothetical protein [Metabacillus flavus]MBS2969546.1 hypothetical protein [Metabacillus flavus]
MTAFIIDHAPSDIHLIYHTMDWLSGKAFLIFFPVSREEQLFIVQALTDLLYEFYLRLNRQWLGSSKWKYRTLAAFDPEFTSDFMEALDRFYEKRETGKLVQIADRILKPFGGRLFDGFSLGKD